MKPITMEEYTTAKCLDEILKHILKSKKGSFFTADSIQKHLFNDLTIDEITLLFKKIQNSHDEVAKVEISEYNAIISANGITERFLKQGGFSKIEDDEIKKLKTQEEKENLEFEKSKIDFELAKKMLKDFPRTKVVSYISIIIGICLALLEIAKATGLINSK